MTGLFDGYRRLPPTNPHACYVRNVVSGRILPCCWEDCERHGDARHEVAEIDGARVSIMIFCSARHRLFYLNSSRQLGMLPPGHSRTIT